MNNISTYLVITPFFPSEKSFVGSYIFDQLNEIRNQRDFKIDIVKTVSCFSSEEDYQFKGFRVLIFKVLDVPYFILPGIFNVINKKRFLAFLKRKEIEDIQFTHSHVSYPASYLVEDLNCKKIVQHHGLDVLQLLNGRSVFLRRIQRNYLIKNSIKHLNKADLNIGVSRKVLGELRNHKGYNPKNEIVVYNGVDKSKFYYIPKRKINDFFTIGCVANFWHTKDHITLIKSVALLIKNGFNCKLRLIGSGATYFDCYNFVLENNLNDNITFEKEMEHEKLNDFYNQIDLFVMPSYYEAFGCVYLEAWASNTPFIAIEDQGISEVIPEKNRRFFLTEKENPRALKNKIEYIAKNKIELTFNPDLYLDVTISNFLKEIKKLTTC